MICTLILLFLVCLKPHSAAAQQVIWANKNNQSKKTDFTKVIGQNKFGVYVLKHRNSNFRRYFIIEHFDRKMNLLKTKTFRIPENELEKIVVHKTGITVFTKEYSKGRFSSVKMMSIDSALNESPLRQVAGPFSADETIGLLRIDYSTSRLVFLVWFLHESKGKSEIVRILTDKNSVSAKFVTSFDYELQQTYIGDAVIDDEGKLYALITVSDRFRSKSSADFNHHLMVFGQNGRLNSIPINDENTFIGSYKLNYNSENQTVSAFGLTGVADEDENRGYFTLTISCRDGKTTSYNQDNFSRKFVAAVIGIKNEQKGEMLSKFKIRKLIPRTDGGNTAVCERVFITTQSDIFYVNGIPQSSYARIFNNDEVLVISLDSNGKTEWSEIINKTQSSVNDGGYYNGIVIMVNDGRIDILYNDRLNSNADIIQVTFYANGEHSKKILFNNEQYYALVIPSECNQVSRNSIVIPVNQNRDFTYIKLLY